MNKEDKLRAYDAVIGFLEQFAEEDVVYNAYFCNEIDVIDEIKHIINKYLTLAKNKKEQIEEEIKEEIKEVNESKSDSEEISKH